MSQPVPRILLVDDSASDALLARHALHRRFAVDCADSPARAIELLCARRYDAVVTDYNMPETNGLVLLQWIKTQGLDVPVIVISGYGDDQVAADVLKLGAYDYVVKSEESLGAIAVAVEHALQRHELERRADLLQQIVEHASDAILTVSPEARILTANPAATALFGLRPEESPPRTLADVFPASTAEFNPEALLAAPAPSAWQGELQARRADGSLFPAHVSASVLRASSGRERCIIVIARDVTERRRLLDRLRRQSVTDNLTGLYNHRHFHERLAQEYERARRENAPLSCIMVDLDFFKSVNDTYGHLVGDETLKAVAGLIADAARPEDVVARYGGEEFALLMPGLDLNGAIRCAEHLWESIGTARIPTSQGNLHLTASVGVATLRESVRDAAELCRRADAALLAAKRQGRNNVRIWNPLDFTADGAVPEIEGGRLEEVRVRLRQAIAPAKMRYFESMRPLVAALSRRAPDLKRHTENVAIYAVELARAAGMPTQDVEAVRAAALLHDVGRVLVEGAADPEKCDGPKGESRSALAGMELLTELRVLVEEVRYVRHHMTPYAPDPDAPERAPSGKAIVLGARVLAVADAYDTLLHGSPTTPPLPPEAAAAALRRMAGQRLDPDLVDLFLADRGNPPPAVK